jgi:hypothetical protein
MDKLQKAAHDTEVARAKHEQLASLRDRNKVDRYRIEIPSSGGFLKKPEEPQPSKTDKERIAELEIQVVELTKRLGG